ncbi:MAG TPA: hypothetical protein VI299_27665 [Polyangiales bacterium]
MTQDELKGMWTGLRDFARELPRVAWELPDRLARLGLAVREFTCLLPLTRYPGEPEHALAKALAELDAELTRDLTRGTQRSCFAAAPGLHAARLMLLGDTERTGTAREPRERGRCSYDPTAARPEAPGPLLINLIYDGSLDALLASLLAEGSPLRDVLAMCEPRWADRTPSELAHELKRLRVEGAYFFSDLADQTREEIDDAAQLWRAFLGFYRQHQGLDGALLQREFRAFWAAQGQAAFTLAHRAEQRQPDEQAWSRRIGHYLQRSQKRALARMSAGSAPARAVHAKHHGCVRASFQVHDDIPEPLRQGVFAEPRCYEALIRLSNSSATPRPDRAPDARGMAIKLLAVGPTRCEQDFVLMNHPQMFVGKVEDLALATSALELGGWSGLCALTTQVLMGRVELRTFLQTVLQRPMHPLDIAYHSATPYRLGRSKETALAVKYSVVPKFAPGRHTFCVRAPDREHADYLAQQLGETLHPAYGDELQLEFRVHVSRAGRPPVEDARVPWPDALEVPVATLTIPRQDIASEAARADCEREFNPWHALPEHLPLGGLNRARRIAYQESAARRSRHVARPEEVESESRPLLSDAAQ